MGKGATAAGSVNIPPAGNLVEPIFVPTLAGESVKRWFGRAAQTSTRPRVLPTSDLRRARQSEFAICENG